MVSVLVAQRWAAVLRGEWDQGSSVKWEEDQQEAKARI